MIRPLTMSVEFRRHSSLAKSQAFQWEHSKAAEDTFLDETFKVPGTASGFAMFPTGRKFQFNPKLVDREHADCVHAKHRKS
jgi:hypothetical protein